MSSDDFIGISGANCLILAYVFTTYQFVKCEILIDLLNLYGSFAIGYNCAYKKALPPLILEMVWFTIAFCSLIKNIWKNYHSSDSLEDNRKDISLSVAINDNDKNYQSI